ncbi:MAG: urease subunit alpha, partial [Candidatus Tectomicrobia bacterium]|nr:urease subunit alpha [Candidatus Tectomicrobia bacterium]
MAFEMRREHYIALYGPTQGDRIRLGDTDLIAYIEKDYAEYGNEVVGGAGKTLRDGMMTANLVSKELELTAVLQGAVIIDPVLGVIKADIGIRDGYIVGIGRAGNPDI